MSQGSEPVGAAGERRLVILVNGADCLHGKGGGSAYLRCHALAAQRAGYEVHLFCLAPEAEVRATRFGVLHRVATPISPRFRDGQSLWRSSDSAVLRWLESFLYSPYAVPLQAGCMRRALLEFIAGYCSDGSGQGGIATRKPVLLHAFNTWGAVALAVTEELSLQGHDVPVVTSIYTTIENEMRGKLAGARQLPDRTARLLARVEATWVRGLSVRWEARACRQSRYLLLNYESVRRLAEREHGRLPNVRRIRVCSQTAFDAPGTAPARTANEPPVILSLSRHDPRKGLAVLLQALARLRDDGVPFRAVLGSGGSLWEAHRAEIRRLGLDQQVSLSNWLEDVPGFLASGDIFVLPSLEEGSGSLALLEAMQQGLAIVASRVDGLPEDINDGVHGLLAEAGNAESLAMALQRLLSDPALRERLGEAARQRQRDHYSPEALVADLGEVYADCLQETASEADARRFSPPH